MIFECPECEARVDGEVIAVHEGGDPSRDPCPWRFSLAACPTCNHPALLLQEAVPDWDEPMRVYPATDMLDYRIADSIRASYEEAVKCFSVGAYTAAAVMCRKTLQGICDVKGAVGSNLNQALADLRAKGLVTGQLHDWADQLRLGGNEAAHDVNVRMTREDARDLKDFTKALVEYIFTIQERFDEFTKRRAAKNGKTAT